MSGSPPSSEMSKYFTNPHHLSPLPQTTSSALKGAIQLGIGYTVGNLSSKPERDVLMQDFYVVESIFFPRCVSDFVCVCVDGRCVCLKMGRGCFCFWCVDSHSNHLQSEMLSSTITLSLPSSLLSFSLSASHPHSHLLSSEGSNLTPAHHYPDFRFKTYAPVAFRYFRELFGIRPDDYLVRDSNHSNLSKYSTKDSLVNT